MRKTIKLYPYWLFHDKFPLGSCYEIWDLPSLITGRAPDYRVEEGPPTGYISHWFSTWNGRRLSDPVTAYSEGQIVLYGVHMINPACGMDTCWWVSTLPSANILWRNSPLFKGIPIEFLKISDISSLKKMRFTSVYATDQRTTSVTKYNCQRRSSGHKVATPFKCFILDMNVKGKSVPLQVPGAQRVLGS